MKLSFSFKKKEAGLEADVEGLISKKMDIDAQKAGGKTHYQIRQEEKRKMQELKHKQEMQKIVLFIGLFVLVLILAFTMAILGSKGII